MKLEDEIKQKRFRNEHHKATVNLLYTGNWVYSCISTYLKRYNLSPEQYNLLRILRGNYPEPASVQLLNERMLDKMSNVSRIVEKLRQKDWVHRQECQSDRRQVDITITSQGLNLLETIDHDSNIEEEIMHHLDASEALQLNRLLDKVRGKQWQIHV